MKVGRGLPITRKEPPREVRVPSTWNFENHSFDIKECQSWSQPPDTWWGLENRLTAPGPKSPCLSTCVETAFFAVLAKHTLTTQRAWQGHTGAATVTAATGSVCLSAVTLLLSATSLGPERTDGAEHSGLGSETRAAA